MGNDPLDPILHKDNAPIVSAELRAQFQGIEDRFGVAAQAQTLGLTVSNPPTQAQVQAIANKLDEVITRLQG